MRMATKVAAVLLLAGAAPVAAQTGNQSDVTGTPITSGDIVGGSFVPGSRLVGGIGFQSTPAAAAYARAARSLEMQMKMQQLTLVRGSTGTVRIAPEVQQRLLAVLSGQDPGGVAGSRLVQALAAGGNAAPAQRLVAALRGLTARARHAASPRSGAAGQLREAVSAYNDLVDAAGPALLEDPPAELLAIRAVLDQLVREASGAAGGEPSRVTAAPAASSTTSIPRR